MSGWEVRFSNSRHVPYFYNPATSQSVWQPPSELSPEQINALPGAAKYLRQPGGGAGGGVRGDQGAAGDGGGKEGQARASHILCKHAGSRRPSSWREANITRPLPVARETIQTHINHLKSLSPDALTREFARIASEESDCSSARKGGDLGWFGHGQMQKSFEDATFALAPGELSDIVESDSGVHVILRTG